MRARVLCGAVLSMGWVVCARPLAAAEPPPKVGTPEGSSEPVAEVTTRADGEQLLARARRAYAEAESYRDEATILYEVFSRDEGVLPCDKSVSNVRFALRKGGDYRYERWPGDQPLRGAGGASLGGTLTVWMNDWGQCITTPARAPMDPEELSAHTWGTLAFDHPLAPSLLRLDRPDILAGLERIETVRVETVSGRACLRLAGQWSAESLMMSEPAPGVIWIDRQSFEVRRFEADVSQMFLASMLEAPGLAAAFERANLLIEFGRAELNPKLTDDAFAFKTPEGMRAMPAFDLAQAAPLAGDADEASAGLEPGPAGRLGRQASLIGQAAPEFSGEAIDGAPIALGDLRGRVVVLDFWATWCGPCIAAMPTMRDLASRFEDKGVVFVGVSLDAPDAKAAIRDVVARERLPYRQFHDARGAVSEAYGVSGIPCVVLIDRQGMVRNVQVGFGPGEGTRLAREIDAILTGAAPKP